MNEYHLSNRLKKVASYIIEGSAIADIGSDHAYLPCYASLKGLINHAIAGEVNEGPYQSAKAQVMKDHLADVISVRKGNGLEVISPGEVDCITIAGMGGQLITEILEVGKEKLAGVKRLILQPNVGADKIRNWFLENEWQLIAEDILEEDGKIYEILVAEKGEPQAPYSNEKAVELMVGPFLLKQKNEAFLKKWKHELQKWKMIRDQLEQASSQDDILERKKAVEEKINLVEGIVK